MPCQWKLNFLFVDNARHVTMPCLHCFRVCYINGRGDLLPLPPGGEYCNIAHNFRLSGLFFQFLVATYFSYTYQFIYKIPGYQKYYCLSIIYEYLCSYFSLVFYKKLVIFITHKIFYNLMHSHMHYFI